MMRRVIAGNKHVADSRGEIVEIIARRVDDYRVSGALHPFVIGTIGNGAASAAATGETGISVRGAAVCDGRVWGRFDPVSSLVLF